MLFKFALALFAICIGVAVSQPTCEDYCTTFMQNCNASNSANITFYPDHATCLTVCGAFPTGNSGDTSGNSVGCRLYHAGAPALSDPHTHCPHASSSGGNVCGDYCDAWCSIGRTGCTVNNGYPLLGSSDLMGTGDTGCHSICSTIFVQGAIGNDLSGNTLACRLYHAQVALGSGPLVHCTHASPNGNEVCGSDTCVNYCQQVGTTCPQDYADYATCLGYCNANIVQRLGGFNTTGDDSLGCRLYHNSAVPVLGQAHCAHADPSGGGVCGSYCTVYCDLIQANCVGSNVQYPDTPTCMSACAQMPSSAPDGSTAGDSVQCRIYHAGVAGNPISNAKVHCPHAGQNGAGVCGGTATTGSSAAGTTGKSAAASTVASLFLVVALVFVALF